MTVPFIYTVTDSKMEEYFQQEDAKNMQGSTVMRENTLPTNFPPLGYQGVF